MENKKQSSIDWLTNKLFEEFGFAFSDNILKQAKEMHMQEIVDAYIEGFSATEHNVDSVEYYNETFNPQNNDN
jgi:hypothetical protein